MADRKSPEDQFLHAMQNYFSHRRLTNKGDSRLTLAQYEKQRDVIREFLQSCRADAVFDSRVVVGKSRRPFSEVIADHIFENSVTYLNDGVTPDFPILSNNILNELDGGAQFNYIAIGAFLVSYLGIINKSLYLRTKARNAIYTKELQENENLQQLREDVSYYTTEIRKYLVSYGASRYSGSLQQPSEFESKINALFDENWKIFDSKASSVDEMLAGANSIRENLQSATLSFETTLNEYSRRYEAMEGAARRHLEIQLLDQLWEEKRIEHRNSFRASIFFLGIIVVATASIVLFWRVEFAAYILELASHSAIAAGVMVSVPVVVFFAFLRIISRVATTSLLLRDDARQRRALAATLKSTIAEPGITLQTELQSAAFEALFRPAPGQPVDDGIHPVIDILKQR